MSNGKRTVVIIEDDATIRNAYSLIIGSHEKFSVVGLFDNFEEALKSFESELPEIVLADIHLPGKSGIDGVRIIKEKWPSIEVIMVTIYQDDEMVFEALKAGASGYITKGVNYLELLSALEEVTKGGAPMSSGIARMLVKNFQLNMNSPLTLRERQILSQLALGKTYSQIADELFISKETSRTHIRNIYLKLNVNSKSQAIQKANKERLI